MKKISFKFNFLLILSVAVSVIASSLATTTYLLYTSANQRHEKDIIQVKGLADNIETFLSYASSLNYQLSIHPEIVSSISRAEPDWEQRKADYERAFNTAGAFAPGSGLPLLVEMQQLYSFVELFFVKNQFKILIFSFYDYVSIKIK